MGRALSVVAAALVLTGAASASGRVALNAVGPKLAVSRDGRTALVTYGEAGRVRHALVWGAVDVSQVRFRIDWSGGWASFHRLVWKGFRNFCRPYDGPALSQLVAACKAPDGSYWALQAWQPNLPHRGYPPWKAGQSDWELDVSHWTGALAELEVHADWAFGHAHDLFGKLSYRGAPVYGRNLYIDTLDSAYGPGWKRETSVLARTPTGVFCYSFWPTHDASLPGRPSRPAGNGKAYRIELLGPGVTPNLVAQVDDPGDYDPSDPAKVAYENRMNQRLLQLAAGDRFCPTQL